MRTTLSQLDGPMPGCVTTNMFVEIEPNAFIMRHTHPGIESSYVLEGGLDLPIQGLPTRSLKAGDGFQVPPEAPHAGVKNGDKKTAGHHLCGREEQAAGHSSSGRMEEV
jgi:quercetin dioxygenase-like cupin family protein